ncbi:MAG: hypothetical protein GY798_20815 [Hyphomicrobiales bacterium]|nr:hypothetical protein [Hyphomicrobiales bacterium]
MRMLGIMLTACGCLSAGTVFAAELVYPAAPPPIDNPVYAQGSMVTGDVSLAFGYFSFEGFETGEVWGTARVNIPFSPAWNEEIEVNGLAGFEDDAYYTYGIYSHTYAKGQQGAAGLLLGASNLAGGEALTAGVEGIVFLPTTSLVGLLAYSWGSNGQPDFWSAAGEARWYWNPNTKLTGSVAYNEFNAAWKWTAETEHRFDGTMMSLFVNGTYYNNDDGDGWEAFAGGRFLFDQPGQTLQGHDFEVPFAAGRAITF